MDPIFCRNTAYAQIIGYGSGDLAGNVVYALLSAFVIIFLTDTVGMNAGVVGTLILTRLNVEKANEELRKY